MYEKLLKEAEDENIEVVEVDFQSSIKGLYMDNVIGIKKDLTNKEKAGIIAEEIGHYYKTYGNILDQSNTLNRKEERKARIWAYKKLVGITKIINAFEYGIQNRYELSDYLEVTEEFIVEAVKYYHEQYGLYIQLDNYIVYFNPLGVMKCL